MTSALRQKYTSKNPSFSSPPGWSTTSGLGLASSSPDELLVKLGVGDYMGSGNDYVQDVSNFLAKSFDSRILSGLFTVQRTTSNSVIIGASKDMYESSSGGAIMRNFIMAILSAGERKGRIAMPGSTKVDVTLPDRKGITVSFNL